MTTHQALGRFNHGGNGPLDKSGTGHAWCAEKDELAILKLKSWYVTIVSVNASYATP